MQVVGVVVDTAVNVAVVVVLMWLLLLWTFGIRAILTIESDIFRLMSGSVMVMKTAALGQKHKSRVCAM